MDTLRGRTTSNGGMTFKLPVHDFSQLIGNFIPTCMRDSGANDLDRVLNGLKADVIYNDQLWQTLILLNHAF